MNRNEIAKKLLALRESNMSGFIMAGVVREALGFDGYGEALRLRWIEPDMDQSGMVTVSNNLGKVAEMRQAASESACKCQGSDCKCGCKDGKCACESKVQESTESPGAHFFAVAHAFRRNGSMGEAEPVNEVATLGLGRTGEAPTTPVVGLGAQSAAPAPAAAPAQTNQPPPRPAGKESMLTMSMTQAEQYAKTKFGRSFKDLTPDQQNQISQDVGRNMTQ